MNPPPSKRSRPSALDFWNTGSSTPSGDEQYVNLTAGFKDLGKAITEAIVVRFREVHAEKRLKKRNAEFLKSRVHHEKFPQMKEFQSRAQKEAENEYGVVKWMGQERDSSLGKVAAEFATLLLSVLKTRTVADNEEQQKLHSRCGVLETTVQELQQQVDELRNAIEHNHKSYDRLEEKFNNLAALQEQMTAAESKFEYLQRLSVRESTNETPRKHQGGANTVRRRQAMTPSSEGRLC